MAIEDKKVLKYENLFEEEGITDLMRDKFQERALAHFAQVEAEDESLKDYFFEENTGTVQQVDGPEAGTFILTYSKTYRSYLSLEGKWKVI